ncbi:MAG: DUF1634 domain-containing protein [Phycisphaerales bacterium]|nr:DUF1634 domain-containing protein [Phycisphaerales bacterium]
MAEAPGTTPDPAQAPDPGRPGDAPRSRSLELALSQVLIAGVAASAAIIGLGAIGLLASTSMNMHVDYSRFIPPESGSQSLRAVLHGVSMLDARAIMIAGVLLLIATPIARVLFSLVSFARQRDMLYIGITTIVLAVLAYSLFYGKV